MDNNVFLKYTYEIKKSKFISYVFNLRSKNEFNDLLLHLKNDHKKASHICYAYKFIDECGVMNVKAFDDGEPKGSAGYPILSLIEKNNLNNIVVFVVRYFGGTKLGVGTLLRSYVKSALNCLKDNKIIS